MEAVARPPSKAPPNLTIENALAAVGRIRAGRLQVNDPDLDFYPAALDDEDVDSAVAYVARYARVPAEVLASEIPDRAVLIAYQRQRDHARHERDLAALLNAGHQLAVPASSYGSTLGMPTRFAVYKRRTRMAALKVPASPLPVNGDLQEWLRGSHHRLVDVASTLVEWHDQLCASVADDEQRAELAAAIKQAEGCMLKPPTKLFASAIAYAVFLLRPDGPARLPDDDDLQNALQRGRVLRAGFIAAQSAAGEAR